MFTLLVLFDAYSVTSRIVSNRIYTETMVGNCSQPLCGIHTNNDVCWDELYFQHANDNGSSCNRQHQTFSNHRGYDVAICCTCCLYTIEILSHFTRICIYHIFFIEIVTQIVRVIIIYPMVKMPISYYFTKVMWPIVKVCSLVWIPPLLVNISIPHQGFIKLIVMCIVCVLSTMVCVYVLGMNVSEREFMVKKVKGI